MNKLFNFMIIAAFIPPFLFGCSSQAIQWQPVSQSLTPQMIEPGEKIEDMVITTGVEDAAPLWSFCLPTVINEHEIAVNCREVAFSKLAIGHTFGVMDLMPEPSDWSTLTWELDLDGHPIDLSAFGTYDFFHPQLALNPSPVREVFNSIRVWDVVLVNPTSGAHTLHGQARSAAGTYTWVVNFSVEVRSIQHRKNIIFACARC